MVATVNYQRLYDMNKKININYLWDLRGGDFLRDNISYSQEGYLGTISPALAIQVLPELYFGATVNIWDDFAGTCNWKSSYTSSGTGSLSTFPFTQSIRTTNSFEFSGLNANLGLLYILNGKYTFGFVYKTPFSASVQKETASSSAQSFPSLPPRFSSVSPLKKSSETITIDMPASYGFGFAYRHSDNLSFAMDIYRTEWSQFAISNSSGIRTNPITGASFSQGAPKDTTQIRTGAEYLFIGNKTVIPVRGGFFYDPEPGKNKVDDFFGFSVGSGLAFDKYALDISYQYRWGNRVTGDIPQDGVNSDIHQHTLMTSLIYHF
jgi:long-subunit fatty acid transport protein